MSSFVGLLICCLLGGENVVEAMKLNVIDTTRTSSRHSTPRSLAFIAPPPATRLRPNRRPPKLGSRSVVMARVPRAPMAMFNHPSAVADLGSQNLVASEFLKNLGTNQVAQHAPLFPLANAAVANAQGLGAIAIGAALLFFLFRFFMRHVFVHRHYIMPPRPSKLDIGVGKAMAEASNSAYNPEESFVIPHPSGKKSWMGQELQHELVEG